MNDSVPGGGVVDTSGELAAFLADLLDLARVELERAMSLHVVDLWAPDLSLRLDLVHEVLGPVHVIACW